jgi:hypothetical protein
MKRIFNSMNEEVSARIDSTAAIADFLNRVLAGGALAVAELEAKARAAGLLGERQQIQHAKAFKKAKKSLGIRSVRDGFGNGGKWAWHLPPEAVPLVNELPITPEVETDRQAGPAPIANTPDRPLAQLEVRRTPQQEWRTGIARLDYDRALADVPLIRWRQFCEDCYAFLRPSGNWAERAAALEWDALALFGCYRTRPLDHLVRAGLLWAVNGGKLVELHRDWAVTERADDRSRRVHHRRSLNVANTILPWLGPQGAAGRGLGAHSTAVASRWREKDQ